MYNPDINMEKRSEVTMDGARDVKRIKLENLEDEALISALRGMSLDVDYWSNVLKNECGLTDYKKLKFNDFAKFEQLNRFVRYDWEVVALRNVLYIFDSYDEMRVQQKEQAQEQEEQCSRVLGALVCERVDGKTRSDTVVKEHEQKLQQTLQIPDEVWVKTCKNLSLGGLIDNFGGQLGEMKELRTSTSEMSPIELLKTASDGLALTGVLVTNDARECANVRETVIELSENVPMVCPEFPQKENGIELGSQAQADLFYKSLRALGHGLALPQGGILGSEVVPGLSQSIADEQMDYEISEHETFMSKVNCLYIPTAMCHLKKNDLLLSKNVLKDLKELERKIELEGSGDSNPAQKMSEDFLKQYGSHINTSVVFGGVYTWQTTYRSEVTCEEERVHNVINDGHNGLTFMRYSGSGITGNGSISGDQMKTDSDIVAAHDDAELSKITMNITKLGGPKGVTAQTLWKMGLLKCSETWAIIDRGSSFDRDFIGIWELIENSPTEFSDMGKLAKALQHTWKRMAGLSMDPNYDQLDEALTSLNQLLEMSVQVWSTDERFPEKAVGYLQQLLAQAEKCCRDPGGRDFWVSKLNTDKGLCIFLNQVMRMKEEYSKSDLTEIHQYFKRIMKLAQAQVFPLRNEISQFCTSEDQECIPDMVKRHKIESIDGLVYAVRQTLLPAMEGYRAEVNSTDKDDVIFIDEVDIRATRVMEVAVQHLQIQLEESNKHYELFLLRLALNEMAYSEDLKCFKIIFTEQSASGFAEKLAVLWEEYLICQHSGLMELQAYLIQLLIQALPENSKSREDDFHIFLSVIQRFLTPDIAITLQRFISFTPYHWDGLLAALDELKKGNKSVLKSKAIDIFALDEISKCETQRNLAFHIEVTPTPDESAPAGKLLLQLGLTDYYPSKISLQDVMSVGNMCPKEDQSVTSLPWRILQKLIMLDYNARDNEPRKTFPDQENACKSPNGTDNEFTFDDILGDSEAENDISLNPIDVFIAVYSCCNLILKQVLAQKMFTCRLAVPYLSPHLLGGPLQYSLWALRSIIVEWKNKYQVCMETSVVRQPIKTISFLRLGKPSCSKSILLNNVISDQAHPTFWNRECPLGPTDHDAANGLVEAQWYIPAGKPTDAFEEVTMFLNLRGDACNHQKQLEILQAVSNVIVCCLETSDLADPNILETMKNIHDNSSKVVLFLAVKDPAVMDKQLLRKQSEQYLKHIGKSSMANTKSVSGFKGNKVRIMEDLKQEMRNTIKKFLIGQEGKSIEVAAIEAEQMGIKIDENDVVCKTGKELAQEVISCMKDKSTNDCKREMLPLQGEDWQEWSKLAKDKQQSGYKDVMSDSIHNKAAIQVNMTELRKKQLEVCNNLSELMRRFLQNLLQMIDSPAIDFYLQWLKIFLDEKSRNTLPGLHREYHKKWLDYYASMADTATAGQLKKDLDAAENMVAEASLGVEHLLREFTQIFEAAMESRLELAKSTREVVDQLPVIAAKLLLKGQPIEIMDGDTANVPLTWVKAVFSSLAELVGNKKLFVISVLGIQSSGKSTLLNTMFGLQFAVSAGRCTRGVYMQLIKVDKERSDLPYDYVLVIDTEGLRAPELGQLKHDNDNQLATFVIGLGDVTILNIKGENVAEVSDVLQIAVHAFLRMKVVNKNFQLHRTCVFIHQNVPAVNAKEKMQRGCQKLKERLDEMTREASATENIMDIHAFSDVIEFDGETNVWYFSDLWHGDPPMAPANPGYSEKVQEVKDCLLNNLSQRQDSFLSFLDMKLRVEDLWKGVLSENFVFNFRNSLAAKAYTSLESTYHEYSWDVENNITEWLTQEATVKLERCSTKEELENCCTEVLDELRQVGIAARKNAHTHLEKFFGNHPLKDIVIEWKSAKTESLNIDTNQFIQRAEREILQRKDSLRVDLVQNARLTERNIEIMTKAKNLAHEMEGQKADDDELRRRFDRFWTERENEYANETTFTSTPIATTVQHQLYKRLEKDSATLQRELDKNPLSKQLGVSKLEDSISIRDIEDSDISVCNSLKDRLRVWFKRQPRLRQYRQAAEEVCKNILRNVDAYVQDIAKLDSGFKEHYATNIIKKVIDRVDEHNQRTEQTRFTLLPSMKVTLAVHACRYALTVFQKMQREYDETQTIEKKLEAFKNVAWNLFRNTVNQCTSEMIAADLLSNHLEVLVKQAVRNRMSGEIVNHVVRYFNQTKYHLIVKILADLTDGPFNDYMSYISNSKDFSLGWITAFTNKEIFLDSDSASSKYATFAEHHIEKLVQSIKKRARTTTESVSKKAHKGTDMWIKTFCDTLRELPIKEDDLKPMMEQNVEDFENLEKLLNERLERLQDSVLDTFQDEKPEDMKWEGTTPYKQILNRLWGCKAQCPYCGEVCQRTDRNHVSENDSHQCIQHRSSGVSGNRWDSEKEERHDRLVIENCNFEVQTRHEFNCVASKNECKISGQCTEEKTVYHPYREYKKFLPDWDIAPSPNMDSSKYWMWFMATYKRELAIYYRALMPDVPEAWHQITKQEALDSLREYVN